MFRSTAAYWNRSFSYVSRIHVAPVLLLAALMAAAMPSSATPVLNRVSCGSSAFSTTGSDPCSVYLSSRTTGRFYVTLSSNNAAVMVPGTVTVRSNGLTTGFNATVKSVTTKQVATITAKSGGVAATFTITLSPATQGTAALSVNATSIGFGSVAVSTPVSQPLTLTSTGTAPVTVNSASPTGTGFAVSGATFPVTLNPGQSVTIEVQFDPATSGAYSSQLTILDSASTATVALSGTGVSSHVELTWASPSGSANPIAGYRVYRAPAGSGSYQVINSVLDSQTVYDDSTVQSGAIYTYYVTTIDTEGSESVASNLANVTVP